LAVALARIASDQQVGSGERSDLFYRTPTIVGLWKVGLIHLGRIGEYVVRHEHVEACS
jgi:hypothetical protein